VLVVLNKQREHPFDVNQRQLQGKYPFIRGFLKTDCDDRLGLDELHRRIKEEINALPHLRDGFPSEWFAVKDHLPRVHKNFVSFDEYRKACRRLKVKSEAEQNLLGRYLHDLGVMLNFCDPAGHVLQTTALVNEAYLRLIDQQRVQGQNRGHFFGVAAQLMRRILVDLARAQQYQKRGGAAQRVSFDEALVISREREADLVALDDALTGLAALDARKSRVVELRFFGGLSVAETAEVLKVSPDTMMRDWSTAKAWL
jgi:RNA polymerase sigma factor (TIGR02999 family)